MRVHNNAKVLFARVIEPTRHLITPFVTLPDTLQTWSHVAVVFDLISM